MREKQAQENAQEQKLSSTETVLDHRPVYCTKEGKSGRSLVLSVLAHWCSDAKPSWPVLCSQVSLWAEQKTLHCYIFQPHRPSLFL